MRRKMKGDDWRSGIPIALGHAGRAAHPHLLRALGNADPEYRLHVTLALELQGARALPALARGLESRDRRVREGCEEIFAAWAASGEKAVLRKAAASRNPAVRAAAARAVGGRR